MSLVNLPTIAMILLGAVAGTIIGINIGYSRDEKPSKLAVAIGLLSGIVVGSLSHCLFSAIL